MYNQQLSLEQAPRQALVESEQSQDSQHLHFETDCSTIQEILNSTTDHDQLKKSLGLPQEIKSFSEFKLLFDSNDINLMYRIIRLVQLKDPDVLSWTTLEVKYNENDEEGYDETIAYVFSSLLSEFSNLVHLTIFLLDCQIWSDTDIYESYLKAYRNY